MDRPDRNTCGVGGLIYTDMQRGFIRMEVMASTDLIALGY